MSSIPAASVFIFEGVAYNAVFLGRVLPAAGKGRLSLPFFLIFNLLLGMAVWSYVKARLTSPGSVPERWKEFVRSMGEALSVDPAKQEWQVGLATRCEKCHLARPERAHHCNITGMCVLRMDHFCPWINNCIGFHNYKYFLLLGIYSWLAAVAALGTSLPDLLSCLAAFSLTGGSDEEAKYVAHHGFISSAAVTLLEGIMTVEDAQVRCTALPDCKGFTFQGSPTLDPVHVYFKNRWDVHDKKTWSKDLAFEAWTSYRRKERQVLELPLTVMFAAFGVLAFVVAVAITGMLSTHLPYAVRNVTSVEALYEGTRNPFDQGSCVANLAQVLGAVGPDWLVPVTPWRPLSDGVSFARSKFGLEGQMERFIAQGALAPEDVWRLRYRILPPGEVVGPVGKEDNDCGPLLC